MTARRRVLLTLVLSLSLLLAEARRADSEAEREEDGEDEDEDADAEKKESRFDSGAGTTLKLVQPVPLEVIHKRLAKSVAEAAKEAGKNGDLGELPFQLLADTAQAATQRMLLPFTEQSSMMLGGLPIAPPGVNQLKLGKRTSAPLQERGVFYQASLGALPSPAEVAVNIALLEQEDSPEADMLLGEYAYLGLYADEIASRTLFQKAADRGSPQGHRWIAFMHLSGRVSPKVDYRKVLIHLTLAVTGGDHWAAMMLSSLYREGRTVMPSCEAARHLSHLAATRVVEILKERSIRTPYRNRRLSAQDDSQRRERDIVHYYEYAANTGDANAQLAVANFYLQGDYGMRQDFSKAYRFYQLAAEQDDERGIAMVGFMHDLGYGVEQDEEKALEHYRRAAGLDDGMALARLGRAHQVGRLGLEVDYTRAQQYFERAVKAGNSDAFEGLGGHALHGWGAKRDEKRARQLFTAASHKGSTRGTLKLAEMTTTCSQALPLFRRVTERSRVAVIMHTAYTEYQRGEKQLAALMFEYGAHLGIESAQFNAASAYHSLAEEKEHAVRVQRKYFSLGRMYFEMSARQSVAESHMMLAEYYFFGKGVDQSYELAVEAYRQAAGMSNAQATFQLAYMYQHGLGVPLDPHLAKRHYDLAITRQPSAIYAWALSMAVLFASSGWEFVWDSLKLSAPTSNFADMRLLGASADSILITFCLVSLFTLLLIRRAIG